MPPTDDPPAHTKRHHDEGVVPLAEEQLDVRVEKRVTGRLRVATCTETHEELVERTLRITTAEVVRVPVGRELEADEAAPVIRVEAGVTIVPVVEERLVIEKRLVLVEEIRIGCSVESEQVALPLTLRRQRVDIERLPPEPTVPGNQD